MAPHWLTAAPRFATLVSCVAALAVAGVTTAETLPAPAPASLATASPSSPPAAVPTSVPTTSPSPTTPAFPAPAATPTVAPPKPPAPAVPAASAPTRIDYPSAAASVTIHPLTPTADDLASGSVEPPETKDAYYLTEYGQPGAGSEDTTYIVAHRWVGADSPFNHIGEDAKTGDTFTLTTATGAITYRVSSVSAYSKDTLHTAPIWGMNPGRVVIITCNSADPWGKNTVITGEPVLP